MENTNLEFRENALKAIAQKAISLKTGARGLRSIIENILMDTMFELPSEPNINEVVINEEVITKGTKPILVHEKKTKDIKSSIQYFLNLKFRKKLSFIIIYYNFNNSEGYELEK